MWIPDKALLSALHHRLQQKRFKLTLFSWSLSKIFKILPTACIDFFLLTLVSLTFTLRTQSLNVLSLKPGAGQQIDTCYAYCQGIIPCLFLPFQSIHLHFFQNLSRFFLCWLWLTHGSCVGSQNQIGHPAGCRFPC